MQTERQLDEHMPAVKLMRKWGSNARFARAIDRSPSTTDRWLVAGYITANDPAQAVRDIVDAAKRDDIIVRPTDFVDMRLFEGAEAPVAAG